MALDNHGDTAQVQGSGAKPYELKNVNGVLSCSCPAWRNQKVKIDARSCKHLRQLRGTQVENARIALAMGQAAPVVITQAGITTARIQTAVPNVAATPRCECETGGCCNVSHDPATCPCTQCTTAEGQTPAEARIAQIRALPGANKYFEPIVEPDRSYCVTMEETRLGRKLRQDEKTGLFGPPVLLAHAYEDYADSLDVTNWWLSEKLDGVRAIWTGEHFVSRQGNIFYAPDWFKARLPDYPLDGELWMGRRKFQQTISVVTTGAAGDRWKDVTYLVFDSPAHGGKFEDRMITLNAWYLSAQPPYAKVHSQYLCTGADFLLGEMARLVALGAEGVMIRKPGSLYETKRSTTLLKVKPWKDDEAEVIGYEPGKGSNKGVTGGLILKMTDGRVFNIGSLTAKLRRNPPPIGTVMTFRYMDVTDDNIPKGASIVCPRNYE